MCVREFDLNFVRALTGLKPLKRENGLVHLRLLRRRKPFKIIYKYWLLNTDTRLLKTAIRSEKCVVRRFRRCANVTECTYTNPDGTL